LVVVVRASTVAGCAGSLSLSDRVIARELYLLFDRYLFVVCLLRAALGEGMVDDPAPPPKSRGLRGRRGASQIVWKFDGYVSMR
jgi:hypothetical protein